jgi:hypothetical protein
MLISSQYARVPLPRKPEGVNVKRIRREIALRKYQKLVFDPKPRLVK